MEYKTNVMRKLDSLKIKYETHSYADTEALSGVEVADVIGEDPDHVFKTLVTVGKSNNHYVFLVPVARELDLKKAAICAGEKSIEMIKSKDLLPLTGYVHGGCSPVGMKKFFKTTIDSSSAEFETIVFSAGKIGYQVEMTLEELKKAVSFELDDIVS
ncbi:Cys-tRNA(Pro)/Cys-tRNA(Cys) deacylase YbaK [bioreactor metagenome]|uniref:Cys-tRNA(Pro)/Cys-tRNA(Cys) deacylase YbaK n=1 Tax=bioreactor metagenome TaxID=1076179 RepID=A0A645C7A0_9ZZZZ